MKKTALYQEHINLNGKMVDFAGWMLPVMYSSIMEEHLAARSSAALFDVSHMGEIIVRGENAEKFLRRLFPTDLNRLSPLRSMYTCFCNETGGVIDDLFVFMLEKNCYYLVVNASTVEKDLQWLNKNSIDGVEIIDVSSATSKIDIQGPLSKKILSKVIGTSVPESLSRFGFIKTSSAGSELMVSQTGYTGELGYELFIDNQSAPGLWRQICDQGSKDGLKPAGLGARNTLRLEACYSLYGHEIDDTISPAEAGIKWIVNSEDDFIGKDAVLKQVQQGPERKIICFEMTGKSIPRDGFKVEKDGAEIGHVTSGTYSPTFKKGLGMALVKSKSASAGDTVDILIRNRKEKAIVVKKPFYKYNG